MIGKILGQSTVYQDITFTLDPEHSNRAIGSDKSTIVFLEYHPLPASNYIQYVSASEKISLCFDNYHNGSCSVFISANQKLSQTVIDNLKAALFVMGFTDSISFDVFGG